MKLTDVVEKFMPMVDDARWAEAALVKEDSQYTRRAYIRSMFALIEGTIWVLKQSLLQALDEENTIHLSPGEREMLSDTTYELKSNGQIKEQTKYLKLTDNLKFTYSMLAKYTPINMKLETSTVEWENFITAINIRNRITHPKTPDDISISDKEIQLCKHVTSWHNITITLTINNLFKLDQ